MYEIKGELPDLFRYDNGTRVQTRDEWQSRRTELRNAVLTIEYGHLPPVPKHVSLEILHASALQELRGARHARYRVITEGGERPFWFLLDVVTPPGDGPFPVILNGDACWRYITREFEREAVEQGYILATFDRTEIVPDDQRTERDRALHQVYPQGDYGALAAWAWGYHRAVDALISLVTVDAERIAVVGHSRGGKASLLAGATDERIAITSANDSGCGGAGSFRVQGAGCEKLENILAMFPYWFVPSLVEYIGRDQELPFDQNALKALVAPRALLTTEALGDAWANPIGTYQTYLAAREVYRFLGVEENIRIHYRDGGHAHTLADWRTLLEFADRTFRGQVPFYSPNSNPFDNIPPAFSWSSP
jgi:dienelactone hydrolase